MDIINWLLNIDPKHLETGMWTSAFFVVMDLVRGSWSNKTIKQTSHLLGMADKMLVRIAKSCVFLIKQIRKAQGYNGKKLNISPDINANSRKK
jgi:hypothetical protein